MFTMEDSSHVYAATVAAQLARRYTAASLYFIAFPCALTTPN